MGVSLLGSFTHEKPSPEQQESLVRLLKTLTKRYGIDPHASALTYRECGVKESCLFRTQETPTISGHRDIGVTSCPGDAFAPEIPRIRDIVAARSVDEKLILPQSTLGYIKNPPLNTLSERRMSEPYIRVRLSYDLPTAIISSASGGLVIRTPARPIIRLQRDEQVSIAKTSSGYLLEYRGERQVVPSMTLSARVLRIDSWDRRPTWDTTGRYRDHLFRGFLQFPAMEGYTLMIVNRLKIEDYLR